MAQYAKNLQTVPPVGQCSDIMLVALFLHSHMSRTSVIMSYCNISQL